MQAAEWRLILSPRSLGSIFHNKGPFYSLAGMLITDYIRPCWEGKPNLGMFGVLGWLWQSFQRASGERMTCGRPAVAVTFGSAGSAVKLVSRHECTARTKSQTTDWQLVVSGRAGGVSGLQPSLGSLCLFSTSLEGRTSPSHEWTHTSFASQSHTNIF